MELESAKVIGAGLAAVGVGAVGIGLGILFGSYLSAAMRNPAAETKLRGLMYTTFALVEAMGLIAMVVSLYLAFG